MIPEKLILVARINKELVEVLKATDELNNKVDNIS